MRFSEALGREIVDTGSATSVGRVAGFVVDPATQRVAGVRVGKGDGDFLAWSDVSSFGVDAVTIGGAQDVRTSRDGDLADQPDLLDHRVLDDHGVEHGTVTDVEFDPDDGRLRYLLTSAAEVEGGRLRGVGTWAAVIRSDAGTSATPPAAPDTSGV